VVQLLGELVDVEQHRAQHAEVGHRAAGGDALASSMDSERSIADKRLVFVVDDVEGGWRHDETPGGFRRGTPASQAAARRLEVKSSAIAVQGASHEFMPLHACRREGVDQAPEQGCGRAALLSPPKLQT
jgi:hypothetical protein